MSLGMEEWVVKRILWTKSHCLANAEVNKDYNLGERIYKISRDNEVWVWEWKNEWLRGYCGRKSHFLANAEVNKDYIIG